MNYEDFQTPEVDSDNENDSSANLWEDSYANLAEKDKTDAVANDSAVTDWNKREQAVFENPKVKDFMAKYQKALESGKVDNDFLVASRELAKRCRENYDTFYFMWHKLHEKGITFSVDEKGISFQRTEYLGGRDGIGHPAIPYGQTIVNLNIPSDGTAPTASKTTFIHDFRPGREAEKLTTEAAAQRIFKPTPEDDDVPVRQRLKRIN